jgi:hypothetical protein
MAEKIDVTSGERIALEGFGAPIEVYDHGDFLGFWNPERNINVTMLKSTPLTSDKAAAVRAALGVFPHG